MDSSESLRRLEMAARVWPLNGRELQAAGLDNFGKDGYVVDAFMATTPVGEKQLLLPASQRGPASAGSSLMNSRFAIVLHRRGRQLAVIGSLALAVASPAQSVQEHVHGHGHDVMPFDLGKTVHVFRMTEDGGVQKVVTRGDSPDPAQVHLVQQHLEMEAAAFRKGDFADPAHLHGDEMPGLRDMEAGTSHIAITYCALPNGAEIRFHATDIKLVTAIHRWFGAQLSEHGADAQAE